MADKNQYQTMLRSKIKSAVTQAKSASAFTHSGVKGTVLEILIGGLFKPLLPSDIGVGTGQIIDAFNTPMSGQIDIILYDKSILPPVLIDEKMGMFPVESVLYTIEVKTTLNSSELSSAHESAKKIADFKFLPGLKDSNGEQQHHSIEKVRSVIFALGTDLSGTNLNEAQRYKNLYGTEHAFLRAICVVGREYWYESGNQWIGISKKDEFDEVLAFIGGVTNTYKDVSKSRHSPTLGHYVIPEVESFLLLDSTDVATVKVICSACGNEADFQPDVGGLDITINGAITSSDGCLSCGGKMISRSGVYKFSKGKLVLPDK